jgi:hypothetical protein
VLIAQDATVDHLRFCLEISDAVRQASYVGVCSAQSVTTEQLLVQPKSKMGRRKSGEPLFGGVW